MGMLECLPIGSSWWDLIDRRADLTPDAVMLEDDRERAVTFGGYRRLAEEVAAGLCELGVEAGQVVSWQLPTTIEAAVLMAALARLGVAQNPVIPILRRGEVGQIIEQVGSDSLIVPGVWRGFDYEAMARDVVAGSACRVVRWDDFPPSPADGLALPRARASMLPPSQDPGGAARWYYYTSGTTAAAKGAKHTDSSVMASSHYAIECVRLSAHDVYPMAFPLTHVGGAMMLTAQLRVGCRIMLIESFDPVQTPLRIAGHNPTLLGSAVPFFRAYLAAQRRHGPEPLFPKLRLCTAGGAPTPPELHRELQRELGVQVSVVGADQERPVGEEGELRLRGPQCFSGYVDSSLDTDAFDNQGFFRTGDLGFVDQDGYAWVTGRLKDVIIRNAENISALEVEEILYLHPSIADVAVVGLPDSRTGERCCAVVVLDEGADVLTLEDMAAHCRDHGLATHKIPEQLEFVAAVPRNSMGKILKREVRAQLVGEEGRVTV
jgi:non-ribosomal peptide synthetase component E (peptide arylation enzyme)